MSSKLGAIQPSAMPSFSHTLSGSLMITPSLIDCVSLSDISFSFCVIQEWPSLDVGSKELRFRYCHDVAFRINRYKNENLVVLPNYARYLDESMLFNGRKHNSNALSIKIDGLCSQELLSMAKDIRRVGRYC